MGKFTLNIDLGNAAMAEGEHVAGALRAVADKLEGGYTSGPIIDENGNTAGSFELDESEPEEGPEFGDLDVTPFLRDDDGALPEGVHHLHDFENGAMVEDAAGAIFHVIDAGPVQGSVEIASEMNVHAYFDVSTLVKRYRPTGEPQSQDFGPQS